MTLQWKVLCTWRFDPTKAESILAMFLVTWLADNLLLLFGATLTLSRELQFFSVGKLNALIHVPDIL